jgi:hypothetical protein
MPIKNSVSLKDLRNRIAQHVSLLLREESKLNEIASLKKKSLTFPWNAAKISVF